MDHCIKLDYKGHLFTEAVIKVTSTKQNLAIQFSI